MKKLGVLSFVIGAVGVYFGYRALEEIAKLNKEVETVKEQMEDYELGQEQIDEDAFDCDYIHGTNHKEKEIDIMVEKGDKEVESHQTENTDETEKNTEETEEADKIVDEGTDETKDTTNEGTITIEEGF